MKTDDEHKKRYYMNEENLSLVSMLRNNPDYAAHLKRKIRDIEKDKNGLLNAAQKYADDNWEEIEEGTKKQQRLISEGAAAGKTEEESLQQYGRFLPTRRTPILNLLYFILREENNDQIYESMRKDFFQQFGHEYDGLNKAQLEQKYGAKVHKKDLLENAMASQPQEMVEYLYGNITLDMFNKVKKLKELSYDNDNEQEAFLAFTACMKLCKKYNLEFDKIPCYRKTN